MRHGVSVYNNVGVGWVIELTDPDGQTITMRLDEFVELCAEVVEAVGSTAYYQINDAGVYATTRRQMRGID